MSGDIPKAVPSVLYPVSPPPRTLSYAHTRPETPLSHIITSVHPQKSWPSRNLHHVQYIRICGTIH